MRARWRAAWSLVWCACAAAAPTSLPVSGPAAPPALVADQGSQRTCAPLVLKKTGLFHYHAREYEAAAVTTARALSSLIDQGVADETRTAVIARATARAPLTPPLAAVALGAPQLHLGVLYIIKPPRLVIFQQNNTAALQQFWRTLASAWNVSSAVWSNVWLSCEDEVRGWWSGMAMARGGGASRAAVALFQQLDGVPCEDGLHDMMGGPPMCDRSTTQCQAFLDIEDNLMNYQCKCNRGYWSPLGEGWINATNLDMTISCAKCGVGNTSKVCQDFDDEHFSEEDFRLTLLIFNIGGMLVCLVIGLFIFKKRKSKAVAIGMWTVLEVVVVGAMCIYGSAACQFLEEVKWRCLASAWLRELGFVACYGSVVLRLWVLLAEFRTRKAHRWTPRDSEVLRVVGAMLSGAVCYLAAFTATAACGNIELECVRAAWHHVTAGAELLLLAAGGRIAYAARNANVPFQERSWLAAALICEATNIVMWRVVAGAGVHAGPEAWEVAGSARAHVSAGAALACVLAPRLWHGYRTRSLAQEVSRRGPAEGFAEGEEEPTSEEVRAELKRLYVQLEILRTKTLRRDNPHISKRRGGRKPHRRFSLQALQARRGGKNKSSAEGEPDASRTPEDSVCSVEGPSHYTDGDTQA